MALLGIIAEAPVAIHWHNSTSYFSPLADSTSANGLLSPQTTESPQTTLYPATVLSPQTSESPQTTEVPDTNTESPQTTEVPQTNESPQTTEFPGRPRLGPKWCERQRE